MNIITTECAGSCAEDQNTHGFEDCPPSTSVECMVPYIFRQDKVRATSQNVLVTAGRNK